MKKNLILTIFALFFSFATALAQPIDYDNLAAHPRLMLRSGDITSMRVALAQNDGAGQAHDKIIAEADAMLSAPMLALSPVEGSMEVATEELFRRIFYLSYSYLTTDDMRYAQRAEQLMLDVCKIEDWNTTRLSDVAAVVKALALGYDWLHRYLPVHSRSIIGTTIHEKGLSKVDGVALEVEQPMVAVGMLYGAMATMERSPEYCKAIVDRCVAVVPSILSRFNPDGSHQDGFTAGVEDATTLTMLAWAMQSAVGSDLDIASHEGFCHSADVLSYLVAPSGRSFNFHTMGEQAVVYPSKYWFAQQSKNPSMVAVDEALAAKGAFEVDSSLPLYMLFSSALDVDNPHHLNKTRWLSNGSMPIYVYRQGWKSSSDTYFAIKGGRAWADKLKSDAGAFVFERDGVRWVTLAEGNYNTPEFDGNYLSDGEVMTLHETALTKRSHGVKIDLTPKYSKCAERVIRTAQIDRYDNLTITDQIECGPQPASIEWTVVTDADAEVVDPNTIVLRQGGKTIYVKAKTRAVIDAKVWPMEGGVRRIGFMLNLRSGASVEMEVSFTGEKSKSASLPKIKLFNRK